MRLLALLGALALGAGAPAPALRVAAASDLKFALDEMIPVFERAHPGRAVSVTYGSSGNFYAQLANRAPFDVFLSADEAYATRLVQQGLAAPDSRFLYAVGRLALWVPRQSAADLERLGLAALRDPAVRRVAIANPRHAPYGRAAEAALRHYGLYEQVQPKLVLGENVAQAAQFAQSGGADAGLIALSLALAPTLREQGRHWTVPEEAHPRVEQAGVILSWARDPAAARVFRAFLQTAEARAVLQRFGFALPVR
jgi:molybdate transport system substrate-binding protein